MIRLLAMGQCAIELDGSRLTAESEVVFGLLLYLAGRAGDAVSREDAQALLWPELPHTRGRHCLRQAAYRLRQLGVPLQADNGSLGVALGDVTSDFAPLVADNAPASAYRHVGIGDILPGYLPAFSSPFAAWVEEYRTKIGVRMRQGLVRNIVDLRSKGRYREVEPLARACLTLDPFNEIATLSLAEATAVLGGNRAEAMAILDRYMDEVGASQDQRLALPASLLRKRISERFVEQRYAAPPDPPFVGREDVLQLLVEKMQEAVAGRSSVVYLWGEPGIGKTRLLEELAKVAHVQGVRLERYTVSPNDPERPLALFSSVLPRMMRMPGAVGISPEAYEAIQRFIDPSAWERVEPPRNAREAALVFGRLKAGIAELFEALADEHTLGLYVDDVHWADNRSIEVLAEVVERVRGRRVAFVLTSRESCTDGGGARLNALCARAAVRWLDGLVAAEVEALLGQIAAQRNFALTSEFVRRTVDTSAGNPLFVSELATHYGWNGVRDDLPHNMHTLLRSRLDALSADALLVFQVCSVLGEHAALKRIESVLDFPTHRLLSAIAEVERASLLSMRSEWVVCRHELLRKEALRRLTPITHQALHQIAAAVLEAAALSEMRPSVCWHAVQTWLAAKEPDRALRLVVTMAGRLLGSGLGKDADDLLTGARNVLASTTDVAPILPLQWRAARAHGDVGRALELALEYQHLTSKPGTVRANAIFAEFAAFDASRAMETQHSRMRLDFTRLKDANASADVLTELALRMVINAEDSLEPAAAHQCFAFLGRRGALRGASPGRRMLFELVYHTHFGQLDVAVSRARELVAVSASLGMNELLPEPQRLRWAHRPILLAGCIDECLAILDQAKVAAQRMRSDLDASISALYQIEALLLFDRLDEADHALAQFENHSADGAPKFLLIGASAVRACLMFARGRIDQSQRALDAVEDAADPRQLRRNIRVVDSLRVLCALLQGRELDEPRLDRLMRSWSALASTGCGDLPFLALTGALLARGRISSATDLCGHYRISRRERFALPGSVVLQYRILLSNLGAEPPVEFGHFVANAGAI